MKLEITGVLKEVRWPAGCENFFIGKMQVIVDGQPAEYVKICGNAELDEIKPHLTYRWYGKWETNEEKIRKWGPQFNVETFTLAKPHGRTGVVKYLQQAPHIGEQTAIQLWNLFNSDAVRICREHPDIVAEKVPRLKPAQCEEIAKTLDELSALEDTSIDLIELLNGRGMPKATARAAVKKWGNKAVLVIQRDPFKLLRFRGIGFMKADAMYKELGLPPARLKRIVYCILHFLQSDSGDTWKSMESAKKYLGEKVGTEIEAYKAQQFGVGHRGG